MQYSLERKIFECLLVGEEEKINDKIKEKILEIQKELQLPNKILAISKVVEIAVLPVHFQ
jgi:hypothetical protein